MMFLSVQVSAKNQAFGGSAVLSRHIGPAAVFNTPTVYLEKSTAKQVP
jgi:hypothetical protein